MMTQDTEATRVIPGWIVCPDCDGAAEHVYNDRNGDPQWDYAVPCRTCTGDDERRASTNREPRESLGDPTEHTGEPPQAPAVALEDRRRLKGLWRHDVVVLPPTALAVLASLDAEPVDVQRVYQRGVEVGRAAQREPLSDEQIEALYAQACGTADGLLAHQTFARLVLAASPVDPRPLNAGFVDPAKPSGSVPQAPAGSDTLMQALRDAVAALGGIRSDNVPESVRIALGESGTPAGGDSKP